MQRRKAIFLAVLAIAFILPAYLIDSFQFRSIESQYQQFKTQLVQKEQQLEETLQDIKSWHQDSSLGVHVIELSERFEKEGFSFFVFKDSTLSYWSENTSLIDQEKLLEETPIYSTDHAFHKKSMIKDGAYIFIGLIQLYRSYSIQNEYLRDGFHPDFQYPNITGINLNPNRYPIVASDETGGLLFLKTDPQVRVEYDQFLFDLLFFIGIGLLFFSLSCFVGQKHRLRIPYMIVLVLLFRWVLFFYQADLVTDSGLFGSDKLAISSFIPSIGDLLLHVIALFLIIYQLGRYQNQRNSMIAGVLLLFFGFFLAYLNIELISHSISSSQLSFDLNNPFELSIFSFILLISFFLSFMSTILLTGNSIRQLNGSIMGNRSAIIKVLTVILYCFIVLYLLQETVIFLWIIPVFFVLNFYLSYPSGKKIISSLLLLILSSATVAYSINYELEQKQQVKTKFVVKKLAEERDPVAEFLFDEIQTKISRDSFLLAELPNYWENKEYYDSYLFNRYFDSYWNQYLINFSICNQNDFLYLNETESSTSCFRYFQNRIRLEGDMISSSNLFQLQNLAGRIDYIGEIPLNTDSIPYRLYIELSANYFNENEGYPDLLLDENSRANNLDLSDYSYAIYNKGKLVFHNGDYNYSTSPKINELAAEEYYSYQTEDHYHTAYKKHENTLIIVSTTSFSFIDFFTSFAYLLIFFSILFLISSVSFKSFTFYFQPNLSDFSIKIQLYITSSLLIALILVAIGSNYYIRKQYQEKNFNNLKDKLRSIYLELESKVGGEEILTNNEGFSNYFSGLLVKFSNVFYTDINFYDVNGHLYSSSRPEVFEKGLKSRRMESIAYKQIIDIEKAEWVQKEKIGELEYLSAYIPFVNYDNEVIGYLNLPYFVRQGKLQEEISDFLVSVINIYVVIFVLSLSISLLLINQLSKPLLLIRNQIRKLKLGSSIELIDWKSQDEIGELVKEYNRIAIELNESAEQLAQSERETAWREMAKQVAHEIKNPLTPMKLSIQHLEAASKANAEDIEERIGKTAETLIQQIDTLSNIATAFSTFAQLPNKQLKRVDLLTILDNTINLYSTDALIKADKHELSNAFVMADEDHLLRLLNNLMKNAVQAGSKEQTTEIDIQLFQDNSHFVLEIMDNGVGIAEDKLQKIFEPNFTTKSSGMGLGLAMSKKIVEEMGADISVQSEQGRSTTFSIRFPIA